jgi:hypothetical protein
VRLALAVARARQYRVDIELSDGGYAVTLLGCNESGT